MAGGTKLSQPLVVVASRIASFAHEGSAAATKEREMASHVHFFSVRIFVALTLSLYLHI
jgi:hypothetical protein